MGMCQNKESLSFRHGLHGNSRIILFLSPYIPRNPCLKASKKSAFFNYDTPSFFFSTYSSFCALSSATLMFGQMFSSPSSS